MTVKMRAWGAYQKPGGLVHELLDHGGIKYCMGMIKLNYWTRLMVFILSVTSLSSQNLISNHDFENFSKCPKKLDQLKYLSNWCSPSYATPDYFNTCSNVENDFFVKDVYSGDGCVGMVLLAKDDQKYREYIQSKLNMPLKKSGYYKFSAWLKRSQYSQYMPTKLDVGFFKKPIKLLDNREIFTNSENIISLSLENTSTTWMKLEFIFTMPEQKEYIIIGNFNEYKYNDINVINRKAKYRNSYYYIDNISLEEYDSIPPITSFASDSVFNKMVDTVIRFNNLNFENGKSEVLINDYIQLSQLIDFLKDNESYILTIYGHTDDIGKMIDNENLSLARAKSVAKYLISQEIDSNRIESIGYGGKYPLVQNDSEQNRAINRRVEFKINEFK